MGLWTAANQAGKRINEAQEVEKLKQQSEEKANEEAKKKQEQHEENMKQGMI